MTWILFWAITLWSCQRPLPLPVSSVKERNSSEGLSSRWSPSATSFPSGQSSRSAEMKFTCLSFPKPGKTWTLGGARHPCHWPVPLRSTPPSRKCELGLQPGPPSYWPSCLWIDSLPFKDSWARRRLLPHSQQPLLSTSLVTAISTPKQTP